MTAPLPVAPRPGAVSRSAPVAEATGGPDADVESARTVLRALADPARAEDPAAALVEDAHALGGVHDALRARLDATAP